MSRTPSPCSPIYLVALASSAGGLAALTAVLRPLPASFPAAILIVQHLQPHYRTQLPLLLSHHSALVIKLAEEHDLLLPGSVFIAPPDFHLIINSDRTLSLSSAAPVCFSRPSADVLFRSAADHFHEQAIAVILSGMGKDGSAGAREIHQKGGKVIAQDQESASYFYMPQAAIQTGCVDYVLPINEISNALLYLTQTGMAL